jgi:site-specific DNA-methyltransferase (adenine-specific)
MIQKNIDLRHGDCLIGLQNIENGTVDVVLTDPPYKYLKNQKLETDFDERLFFYEVQRILKPDGFIVCFGRGVSFYRWCSFMNELNFKFLEEMIWDKSYTSSPVNALSRVHETIAIFTKQNGKIKRSYIPYLEQKQHDVTAIVADVKRIKSALKNNKSFDSILYFLKTKTRNDLNYNGLGNGNKTTVQSNVNGDRGCNTMQSIENGMREKSIIKVIREHYKAIHPTQKPVRLLERLLALVSTEGDLVIDPFAGSGSTAVACHNTGRRFVGFEIDKGYFEAALLRVESLRTLNIISTVAPTQMTQRPVGNIRL